MKPLRCGASFIEDSDFNRILFSANQAKEKAKKQLSILKSQGVIVKRLYFKEFDAFYAATFV
jgi:regulatory protein YycH of two-component signal transduction system YycFG